MAGPASRGGGGSGAVRAGRAFVELFAKDNLLYRALDAAQARLQKFGAFSRKVGLALGAGGSAILAPMAKTFTDAVSRGAHVDKIAKRFDLTTESVSGLAYAFQRAGVDLDEFEGVLDGLAGRVKAAADANEDVVQGLANFRTNGRQLLAMPLDRQLAHLADAFARIANPVDQATVSQELFGAAGHKMLEVLKRGSVGLAEWGKEARAANALVSADDAKKSTAAMQEWRDTLASVKGAVSQVGFALVGGTDGIKELGARARSAVNGLGSFTAQNRETAVGVAKVAAGAVAAGAALVALGPLLAAAAAGALALVSPVGLAVAGLAAVALKTADAAGGFRSLAADAAEAWGGIAAALSRGDLGAAAGVGLALVNLEWAKAVAAWTEHWNGFKDLFVDGWFRVQDTLARVFADAVDTAEAVNNAVLALKGIKPAAAREELAKDLAKEKAAREEQRKKDLEAAREQLRLAKEQFRLANDAARAGPGVGAFGPGLALNAGALALALEAAKQARQAAAERKLPKIPGPGELFNAVKGTFALPYARMQLAYGDTAQKRQLDATEKIARNAEALPEIRRAVEDVGKKLAFR